VSASRVLNTSIKYYDVTAHLDGSPHGGPFAEDSFVLAADVTGRVTFPNQICATLSYYDGTDVGGTTRGDHRGRMFLGPLSDIVVTGDDIVNPRLQNGFCLDRTAAFGQLAAAADALANPKVISVWSRKDSVFRAAIGCWMNNSLDTQRRRAVAANYRATQAI
jgi:hypothetical protein